MHAAMGTTEIFLMFGCIAALGMLGYAGWIGPKILRQLIGQRILRYASLDDIAIWGVLALILLDWDRVGRQLGFLAVFAVATVLFRKLMVRLQERDRWYVGLIWLTAWSFSADRAGLHYMVGAFLAGTVMDAHWFDQKEMDLMRHHVLLAIMPSAAPC